MLKQVHITHQTISANKTHPTNVGTLRNIHPVVLHIIQQGDFFMKKINFKALIIAILIPLAVGGLSALLTRGSMESFEMINKPPLSPPAILFPIVWTILYTLMGLASYFVYVSDTAPGTKRVALTLYGTQLIFNFFWSILFFNLNAYLTAFVWLVILLVLIIATTVLFYAIDKKAGYLMIPYILWVTFAGYLNLAIYFLN